MRFVSFASLLVLTAATLTAQTTTTLSSETSNNTAACSAAGSPSYCQAGFTAMTDSASGTFNPAPANVSTEEIELGELPFELLVLGGAGELPMLFGDLDRLRRRFDRLGYRSPLPLGEG